MRDWERGTGHLMFRVGARAAARSGTSHAPRRGTGHLVFRVGARAAAGNGTTRAPRGGTGKQFAETLRRCGSAGISMKTAFPRKPTVENHIHIFKESLLEPYIVPLLGKNVDLCLPLTCF